jgi:hypothetical protein
MLLRRMAKSEHDLYQSLGARSYGLRKTLLNFTKLQVLQDGCLGLPNGFLGRQRYCRHHFES